MSVVESTIERQKEKKKIKFNSKFKCCKLYDAVLYGAMQTLPAKSKHENIEPDAAHKMVHHTISQLICKMSKVI